MTARSTTPTVGQDAKAQDAARAARTLTVEAEADARVLSLRGDELHRWIRGALETATDSMRLQLKAVRDGEELSDGALLALARRLIVLSIVVEHAQPSLPFPEGKA